MKYFILLPFVFCYSAIFSQTNYAIQFNGSNQYAAIAAPIPSNSSYTKEAWVYCSSAGGSQNIISSANAPFWISGNVMQGGQGGTYSYVGDIVSFPVGQWVHAALTYDAATTTMKLYRDGMLVGTNTSVANNYSNENIFIGSHTGGNSLLNGAVDEVRIWSVARTQDEIKATMFRKPSPSAPGLLASYHCDEASGSILVNATGGTNGTLFNSPVWTASPIVYSGNALSIDGIDDQVTVPHPISGDFTLEYLMKTSATGINGSQWFHGSGIIDAEVGGQTYDWGTSLLGSRLAFGIGGPGIDRTAISTIDVNTGNWVHVAVSWRQSTGEVKMYIDGVDQGSFSPTSTQPRSAPTRIVFGSLQTNSRFYTGAIDEVRIWNVVRTQAEIQADMNKELKPATATSLLAYYTFDQGLPAGTNPGLNTIYDLKGNNNGVLNNFALTGTSSNYIAQNNALITLPLQWLKFTAYQVQATRQVKLEWTTGAELNTKDFLVQHSINSTDWNNIAVLPSAGINTGQAQYSFVHKEPALSANYYRILQRDIDNRTSYSPVQLVNLKAAREGLVIINPRVNTGILQLRLAEAASISIFNTTGHLMKQLQFNAGTQVINVHQFPKGIYVLSNGMEAKKFFVE